MTKLELTENLVGQIDGLSYKKAELIVNTFFESMTETLASGERIEIKGFGIFGVKERKARATPCGIFND